jgi:hypothetical protein
MNWIALKYMLLDLFRARMGLEVMVSGSGAESKDPCSGVGAVGDVMGGPS